MNLRAKATFSEKKQQNFKKILFSSSIKIASVDIPAIIGIIAYIRSCHKGAISVPIIYPVRLIVICDNNIEDMGRCIVIFIGITVIKNESYKRYQ